MLEYLCATIRRWRSILSTLLSSVGMRWEEVVRIHSETKHYVYMLGFAPGHPYLGDLPQALTLPRRKDPPAKG